MKKKQLEKYINEYRATTKVSPDKDLCKRQYTAEQPQEDVPDHTPIYRRLSFWGVAVIVLVMVSVLPAAVVSELKAAKNVPIDAGTSMEVDNPVSPYDPVSPCDPADPVEPSEPASQEDPIGPNDPVTPDTIDTGEPSIYYADETAITYDSIDDIEGYLDNHQMNVIMPTLDAIDKQFYTITLVSTNETIGISSQMFIYSEDYFSLIVYTFSGQYALDKIEFQDYTNEATIQDTVVSYKLRIDDEDYIYSLEFKYNGYLYQAIVTCYDEKPIPDILSDCFGL